MYERATQISINAKICDTCIGETPYSRIIARGKKYSKQKVKKITEAIERIIISGETIDDGSEMIQQVLVNSTKE